MLPEIEAQLQADRDIASTVGDDGWTLLHQEALSGNLGVVKLLVSYGADASARTPNGYTAPELAQKIGWPEITDYINEHGNA
jgi:ankyrin repeat protein